MVKRWILTGMAAAAVVLAGCSSNQGFGDNADCDYRISPSQEGSFQLETNRCVAGSLGIGLEVEVVFLGPEEGLGDPPTATDSARFMLEYYDITYENRLNNGTTPGVDVPFPQRFPISHVFDLTATESLTITPATILFSGSKNEAPLNSDAFFAGHASGIPFAAHLTFWGRPLADPDAWCFANFDWFFTVTSTGC